MQEVITRNPSILILMVLLSITEFAWVRFRVRRNYDVGSSMASIGVAFGQALIKPLTAGVIASVYFWLHAFAPIKLAMGDWRVWGLGFFALEFAYYWFHRWSHRINWLWATHAVHHSPNELTLPAAIRLGWTGLISGGWLVFAALALLGFPPAMIGILLSLNLLYQFSLHTEAIRKLGPLEWVLNTPSHHRAHHASDAPFLDCNFGGVLIIFDRWFGTFVPEPEEGGLRYGLTNPVQSNNPLIIAFTQWGRLLRAIWLATGVRGKLRITLGAPELLNARVNEKHDAETVDWLATQIEATSS